ncbi:hypothetical protein A3A39_04085 [Candidatus Kaiserbacteria bacterium RIFCSPLOWO2_01_FULL_54_13]|uniref:Uncharacterized protein n=1 Tax=Candidatus Kaiserbacteria bacterium RIFCSPLOWO2_01_FULL_54_13 TaxID=1798512 RepID=A0A1F6F445_9BACT|nr:MAG: hypothetical protein A3A39_04085 [Candidatus Kaiserbacteria bacterium RIFCSPLOWO2_01_FULL_54_13]
MIETPKESWRDPDITKLTDQQLGEKIGFLTKSIREFEQTISASEKILQDGRAHEATPDDIARKERQLQEDKMSLMLYNANLEALTREWNRRQESKKR